MVRLLDDVVILGPRCEVSRFLHWLLLTVAELSEGRTKFLRHEIVNHWVDGTVEINANSAKEQEPIFLKGLERNELTNYKGS